MLTVAQRAVVRSILATASQPPSDRRFDISKADILRRTNDSTDYPTPDTARAREDRDRF
jgi:hypothetical protein